MTTTIYITFHEKLYDIYGPPPDDVRLVAVEVRPERPKQIDASSDIVEIIREWEIPGFINLQEYRFNESSVIINLRDSIASDFVGFFQYDMIPSDWWLKRMKETMREDVCVCGWLGSSKNSLGYSIPAFIPVFRDMIEKFNSKYGSSKTFDEIFQGIPLVSNFVMHSSAYREMIEFYYDMTPQITSLLLHPDVGTTHIAGFLERFWGVFLKCRFGSNIVEIPVEHADHLRVNK
jgi:hypothetical protein